MIEEAGQVIGFINAAWFWSVWAHGKALFVDDFFLSMEFRGQGLGKKALDDLESLARAEGYARV